MLGVCTSFWYWLLFSVRKDLYLWILAEGWLPPDRKKLTFQCSSRDAPCLTVLPVCPSIHFKAALGIFILTSTNKCSLETVGPFTCTTWCLQSQHPTPQHSRTRFSASITANFLARSLLFQNYYCSIQEWMVVYV